MFCSRHRVGVLGALLLLVAFGSIASAQRYRQYRLAEGPGVPVRFPPPNFEDGAFTACKLMYTSSRREAGGIGWSTDYPFAAVNLMTRLSELTATRVSHDSRREVNYWVVRLTDPALFECPFLIGTDVGTATFSDEETKRLREYLLKGGFLWVDDFWGTEAWDQWSGDIRKVLPEFPIFDVPVDHPIRSVLFSIAEVEQVTSINRGFDGAGGRGPALLRAVLAEGLRAGHQLRPLLADPLNAKRHRTEHTSEERFFMQHPKRWRACALVAVVLIGCSTWGRRMLACVNGQQ